MALQTEETNVPARWNLAELLFGRGRFPEARGLYEEILKAENLPVAVDVTLLRLRLGVCCAAAGHRQRAAEALNAACEGSVDPVILRESARQFFNLERFGRAKTLFERAYELSGGDAESAWLLAMFHLRVGDAKLRDLEQAAVFAEVAFTAKPDEPRFVSTMAEVEHARRRNDKAAELMERALKLLPDSEEFKKQLEEYRKEAIEEKPKPEEVTPKPAEEKPKPEEVTPKPEVPAQ